MKKGTTSPNPRRRKKSWREKLNEDRDLPKVVRIEGHLSQRWGQGTCVIPSPREVNELMRQVPYGKLTTIDHLRATLAARHGATLACPMTTGIFAWISAHAAAEATDAGEVEVTPYWRTLKARGELNPKYPGGIRDLITRLETEGHAVIQRGQRHFVRDYGSHLA